jgi:arylsulfatase
VDTNLGWKGSEKYVAGIPQVFDFWQGPQERYDILMNNFTEQTWMAVVTQQELTKVMTSCVRYPPHKMQSYSYTDRSRFRFRSIGDQLEKEGVHVALPTGN